MADPQNMKIKRFQQLKIFYGIALTLIALTLLSSSILMQHAVRRNDGDARVINLSGRQRMLSQRLTKCALALNLTSDGEERTKRLHEISESLMAWKAAHLGLQHGDKKLGLPPRQNSAAITALFAEIEPFHTNMVQALEQMIAQVKEESSAPDAIHATAEVMLRNEPRFLELMDEITFQFDKEAKERIFEMQRMERGSLYAGLLVLVLEFLLVFRPSLSQLAEMMNALQRQTDEALVANEQVRENEVRLRTILQTAMDGFCRVDAQGRILEVNESYCRMSGYGEQELIGQSVSIMEALEEPAEIAKRIREIKERGWDRFESIQRRKDGNLFDVEVCAQCHPDERDMFVFVKDISARKRTENALMESESTIRALLNATDESIHLIDLDGSVLVCNQTTANRLGVDISDLIGKRIYDFFPPDVADARKKVVEELFASDLPSRRQDTRQGRIFESSFYPIKDTHGNFSRMAIFARDITERKQAEDALRASERRFRAIIDASPIPFALNDDQQNITFLNAAFHKVFGYDVSDIPTLADWWPKAYPDTEYRAWVANEWCQRVDKANETGSAFDPMEVNIRCKDGTQRTVIGSAVPLGEQLRSLHLVVLYDITERKIMEEKFLRSQRVEAIGTLAAGVAHDLNNILSPIMLSAEMLHVSGDIETREGLIHSIEECAHRGASVVNQLLTFARGTKGERRTLQMNHLIDDMVKIGIETFPKSISITSFVASDIWPITGDPTQIHQVLLNLCINARDAMPGGGTLRISAQNAEIDENFAAMVPDAQAGNYAMLAVSDTGRGIAREIVLKIFDPFFTTKELGKGTGLGLSTVAGIVRSHGGFVTVESSVGHGTTFKVFLPRETSAAAQQERLSPTEIPKDGGGATILVVEDEGIIAKTISMVLKNSGYEILTAFDGNEALAVYRENAHKIALVLTDVMMPGMDGVELTRGLHDINPNVKIIASTGQATETRQAELRALGVDVILRKPYDAKNLLAALHEAIHTGDTFPAR